MTFCFHFLPMEYGCFFFKNDRILGFLKVGKKKRSGPSFERCSRNKFFFFEKNFFLVGGRAEWSGTEAEGWSGAERSPAANQKKKVFFNKKKKVFSRNNVQKLGPLLFFFQAFKENMFLIFECFLEKIMHFRNLEQSVRTSFFCFSI